MNLPATKTATKKSLTQAVLLSLLASSVTLTAYAEQDFQTLLDEANQHANLEQYEAAIAGYESLLQQRPDLPELKNNLSVLYFNQAMTLQNHKQYQQAEDYFKKAQQLTPQEQTVNRALAANYYYQAMELKNNHSNDYQTMRQLMTTAIDIDPNEAAFKTGLAVIIHRQGIEALNQKPPDYQQAENYLTEALGLEPNHPTLKHTLAQTYLTLANQQTDKAAKQQYVDKALALENSETIQQQAQQVLSGSVTFKESAALAATNGISTQSQPMSVAQKLAALEKSLNMPVGEDTKEEEIASATLLDRMDTVEKQIYGKKQKGSLTQRADNAYYALFGSGQNYKNSTPNLIQASIATTEGTYLDRIFQYTDGRVVRWNRFPVRVYIETPEPEDNDIKLYQAKHLELVKQGLNSWRQATNNFVSYTVVKNPKAADIFISFSDELYENRYADKENVDSNELQTYEPPKNSKVAQAVRMAGMFAPGLFSLAPQAVAAGIQYREYQKLQTIIDESKIELGLGSLENLETDAADNVLVNMAAQAFGHALGIKGTSKNQEDLMYPQLISDYVVTPSEQDVKTLMNLYQRPANIVLNVR